MTLIVYARCVDGHILAVDRKESDDANIPNPVRKYYMPDNQEFVLILAGSSIMIDMVVDSLHSHQDITGENVIEYLRAEKKSHFQGNVPDIVTGILMAKVGDRFRHYKVTITNSTRSITEDDPEVKCEGGGGPIATYLMQKLLPSPQRWKDTLPLIIEIINEVSTAADTVGGIAKYGADVFVFKGDGELRHHRVKDDSAVGGIECRLADASRAQSALFEATPSLRAATVPGTRTSEGRIPVAGTSLEIGYKITGGTIDVATLSERDASVVMDITALSRGSVSVSLPRSLIDSKSNGADDDFCVLLDGCEVKFDEAQSEDARALTVEFDSGSTWIEVIGTETTAGRAAGGQGSGRAEPPGPSTESRKALSIQTDKPKYNYGADIIIAIFNPYFKPEDTMDVEILDESEEVLHSRRIPVAANAMGRYQHVVRAEGKGWRSGSRYSVRCTFDDKVASVDISLSPRPIRLSLDKDRYSWRDLATVTVAAPGIDLPSGGGGEIGGIGSDHVVSLRTSRGALDGYRLVESRPGSGIFVGQVRLTGFADASTQAKGLDMPESGTTSGGGPFNGRLACGSDDSLTLELVSPGGTVEKSTGIAWTMGTIEWVRESDTGPGYGASYAEGAPVPDKWTRGRYESPGYGIIRLYDLDAGRDPRVAGTATVEVKSGVDREGIGVTLFETGAGTGIYEGVVYFDPDGPSSGQVLHTSAADTVTAQYTDVTPPPDYDYDSSQPVRADIDIVQPTETPTGITASNPRILDAGGNVTRLASLGEGLRVCADFANKTQTPKKIVMAVTVNGAKGGAAHRLPRLDKVVGPGESTTLSAPWTPTDAGVSSLEVLVGAAGRGMPPPSPLATLPISLVDSDKGTGPDASLADDSLASKGDPAHNPPASPNRVCKVGQDVYKPDDVSVRPGHTVTWINSDAHPHTITSGTPKDGPDGMFDSGLIDAGSSFSYRFKRRGRYRYFCIVHPWQEGVVTVL